MVSPHTVIGKRMAQRSGVREIMKDIEETIRAAAGRPLINLSAGNPVILPEIEAMWRRHTQAFVDSPQFGEVICRYGSSQGYEPLIDAVVDWFNTHYQWGITRRNVLVTPGSQSFYFLAANCFGGYDEHGQLHPIVLPLCPDYTGYGGLPLTPNTLRTYKPTIDLVGPHRFKYRPDFEQIQLDETVGAVLFSRPCNPTGNLLTDDETRRIVRSAAEHNIPVLIDSAYAVPFPHLVFTDMELIWAENVIHCMSLSKAGLPGERVGIAIGAEQYISVLESFQSNVTLHSSRYGQAIAAAAINSGELAQLSATVIRPHYQHKLATLQAAFEREMADLPWYLHQGEGTVFSWLWLKDLPISDLELYQQLKQEGVVVVPGSSFFPGLQEDWPHKQQCLRISLTASEEALEAGVAKMARVIERSYATVANV